MPYPPGPTWSTDKYPPAKPPHELLVRSLSPPRKMPAGHSWDSATSWPKLARSSPPAAPRSPTKAGQSRRAQPHSFRLESSLRSPRCVRHTELSLRRRVRQKLREFLPRVHILRCFPSVRRHLFRSSHRPHRETASSNQSHRFQEY